MARITKKVDRAVDPRKRTQVFTTADADEGDILMIKSSLGHSATHLNAEATGGALKFHLNVIRSIVARRVDDPFFPFSAWPNVAKCVEVEDDGMGEITVAAGESFTMDDDLVIDDIQLTTISGTFSIFVS
jgi:hypothetical protein